MHQMEGGRNPPKAGVCMLVRIMTLPFHSAMGGFDDSELRNFIKDKDVIAIQDHLFIRNEVPYLTLIIKYFLLRAEDAISKPVQQNTKRVENWKELLSEADLGLFNMLREWRSRQCQKEGVPPYILFTNKQLAEIVKLRPQTVSEIGKVEGVGTTKIEKYGIDVLRIFQPSGESK